MTISRHHKPACLFLTTSAVAIGLALSNAHAQSAPPAAAEPAAKQDGAKPQKRGKIPTGAPKAYAFATKAPAPALPPAWTGFYGGVTFGPTLLKGALTAATQSVDVFTFNIPPTTTQTQTTTINQLQNSSGSGWGALADGHMGYNLRLGNNVVAGVQGEVTLSGAETQTSGVSQALTNTAFTRTPPFAGGTVVQRTSLTNATIEDSVLQRWAVSALARLGVLVDPRDLVYVIGGYTYGGFEWDGRSFGLNGAAVGLGWEREILPTWTFRGEYRYTAFDSRDLTRGFSQSSASSSVPAGAETQTDAFNQVNPDHVSGFAQHTLRLGLSHSFGGNAPAGPGAYAMAGGMFAPMPAWQGLYGGVSFGASSIMASAPTTLLAMSSTGSVTNGASAASGNGSGAQSDLYLGYNFGLGGNVIAGLQVEGTIADIETAINPVETDVTTPATPNGTTVVQTVTTIAALNQRWAASALGRLGVLADSRDLIYGIGGFTHGRFLWTGHVFGADGAAIGAGWERQIAPSWTLRAEYRYTAFADTDFVRSNASNNTVTSVTAAGKVTTTSSNSAAARQVHIAGLSEQALRFGISHYFNEAPGVGDGPGAFAMATKAPKVAAPMWTGVYGGVSGGLTSLNIQTTTLQFASSSFNETFAAASFVENKSSVSLFTGSDRHAGATGDIFLGYNTAVTAQVIAGVQAEGSLSHAAVLAPVSATFVTIDTQVQTPPGTPFVLVTNGGGGGGFISVQSRWMASALAKAGWLVDPHYLIYVVGGWTYGQFNSLNRPFELSGPTVGAGIEREIVPTWTLRAEYRYTQFAGRDVPLVTNGLITQTSPGVTTSQITPFSEPDHISANMQAVRLGIAHYLGN